MKITKVHIENYRSIKHLDLEFPKDGMLILVGPNNAGKSNILRAINNIVGDKWFRGETAELNDFHRRDKTQAIRIDIEFDNRRKIIFDSQDKWPTYYGPLGKITSFSPPSGSTGNVKEDFPCTYLPADRSIEKSFRFDSWALMGSIAKAFNNKAQPQKNDIEDKFNEVMAILESVDGFTDFKKDFVDYFDEMQADTPYRIKVDFKAFSPLNYFKSIQILANDASLSQQYDIDVQEMGDGNKHLLLFALVRSFAKNFKQEATGLLAIEEPEIYLHPQARRHLYTVLDDIVRNSNFQVLLTTHSSSFVHTQEFYKIGLVRKIEDEGTLVQTVKREAMVGFCQKTGVPPTKVTVENITEHYSSTSHYSLNEAFFARFLILVEGESEEMALPVYLHNADIHCDRCGISVIGVQGKGQIPKYWRLFHQFGIPMIVLFDNDASPGREGSNKAIADCFNLTTVELLSSVSVYKKITAVNAALFSQDLLVFEVDFETAIKKDFENFCSEQGIESRYDEFEDEAKREIKPTKPTAQKGQIARFIARRICENHPDYIPSFISEIAGHVKCHNAFRGSPIYEITPPMSEPETDDAVTETPDEVPYTSSIRPEDLPF